jgi:hypothetical protein
VGLFWLLPAHALAQVPASASDGAGVVIFERSFVGGTSDNVEVPLKRRVWYYATLSGAGAPEFLPAQHYHQPALVVPVTSTTEPGVAEFEVYAGWTGPHYVRVAGLAPGSAVTLRLYRNDSKTESAAVASDHDLALGLSLGGGIHSGYRLDPTGGPADGGSDVEGCLLTDTGHWFSICLGAGRQTLPSADLKVLWFFLEPRARLISGHLFGDHRFDLGTSIRLAQGTETGEREISPSLAAVGVYAVHHLSADLRQRGWSIYTAWQYGRLGNVPETEDRDAVRLTAGLNWVP